MPSRIAACDNSVAWRGSDSLSAFRRLAPSSFSLARGLQLADDENQQQDAMNNADLTIAEQQ